MFLAIMLALAAPTPPPDSLLAWMRQQVPWCTNPEEVVRRVFGRVATDHESLDYVLRDASLTVEDLGDGTTAYVFSASPGNGRWAAYPNSHFLKVGSRLELFFQGRHRSGYAKHLPRVGARYQLQLFRHVLEEPPDSEIWSVATYFWSGTSYVLAFTDTNTCTIRPGSQELVSHTRTWNESAKRSYLDSVKDAPGTQCFACCP